MNKTLISFATALIATSFAACDENNEKTDRSEARHLFVATVNLTAAYCDSMKLAADSAAVARLDNAYQAQLTRLNMGVAPETDTKLTEGENDTLYILTRKYVMIRSKMERLTGAFHSPATSLNPQLPDTSKRKSELRGTYNTQSSTPAISVTP